MKNLKNCKGVTFILETQQGRLWMELTAWAYWSTVLEDLWVESRGKQGCKQFAGIQAVRSTMSVSDSYHAESIHHGLGTFYMLACLIILTLAILSKLREGKVIQRCDRGFK